MAKGDDAAAVEASLIENIQRLPMDDMDQFEAFQRLLKEGRTIEEIANTFGVTEIMVKRRLAIANLSPKIRTAYRAEEIDGETLRTLTLASKQQQKDWLLLFEDPEQHAPKGSNLKRWLLGGSQIPTTNAIFDITNYTGEIVSDLFGEESYFANPDTFWHLQLEAINKLKASFETNGWSRVEVMEQDKRFNEWEYEKTAKKKGGAVFISVSDRGEVEAHEGYLTRAEVRKAEAKATGNANPQAKNEKPELTKPMQNYVELHRLAATRLELLNHPHIALRLVLAHMIVGSNLWMVKPEPMKPAKPEIGASVAANPATTAFNERRKELLSLCGFEEDRCELVRPNGDDYSLASLFARLLKLPEDDVLRLLALAMAETLACGTATAEATAMITSATLNDWRPDDTFFDLLAGKDVVHAMLADIASPAVADGNKGETTKVQKGIIKDFLYGTNGREHKMDWLPPYFQFPPKAYTERGGTGCGDSWNKAAAILIK
jgi:ParB family transcriptional regulator, chromosome partitioning protein